MTKEAQDVPALLVSEGGMHLTCKAKKKKQKIINKALRSSVKMRTIDPRLI